MITGYVGLGFFFRHPVRVRIFGEQHYRYFTSLAATGDLHTIEVAYYFKAANIWFLPQASVPLEHWAVADAHGAGREPSSPAF